MNSNNLVLSEMEHSHEHCEHSQANTSDAEVLDIDDEGLEHISLVSSPQAVGSTETQSRMSNKLKVIRLTCKHHYLDTILTAFIAYYLPNTRNTQVDNFYIDGEGEEEDLDLCGYLPSGLNSSALAEEISDTESTSSDEAAGDTHEQNVSDLANILHDLEVGEVNQGASALEISDSAALRTDSSTSASVDTTNMALLQRAYQAEQRRVVETLSCSESDDEGSDCDHDTNTTDNTATATSTTNDDVTTDDTHTPIDIAEALAEFQKYSARYRDINSADLLHSINTQRNADTHNTSNSDDHEVGVRWYDDVEEFVQED